MLILIIVFFVTLLVGVNYLFSYLDKHTQHDIDTTRVFTNIICGVFIGVLIISTVINVCQIASENAIKEKIVMYEEENKKIELQMSNLVQKYMDYEAETYLDFKPEEGVELISLYPDLKSDNLVVKQIDTYTENMREIKILKSRFIDLKTSKWLLYFGR